MAPSAPRKRRLALVVASRSRAIQMLATLYDDAVEAGFEVSVIAPASAGADVDAFLAERGIPRIPLAPVSQRHPVALLNHFRYFTLTDFRTVHPIIERFRQVDFGASGFFLPYVVWPVTRVLRFVPPFSSLGFWDWLETALFGRHGAYRGVFAEHRFDWVVFPPPVLRSPAELVLFLAAKRAGVPIAAADEAYGEFFLPISFRPFDRIFVWNRCTIEQAATYRGLPTGNMTIAGAYRFDPYFRDLVPTRDAYAEAHGLDPSRPFVSCILSGLDIEFAIIDRLAAEVERGRWPGLQILVRPNPFLSKASTYATRYGDAPHIIVTDPAVDVQYEGFAAMLAQAADFGGLLKWSAATISHASTAAIEGAIFDTPALYHLFGLEYVEESVVEGRESRRLEAMRRHAYDTWPFINEALATGAIPLARSLDELVDELDRQLANPALLAKERQALVAKICTYTDGRSGSRIMRHLYEETNP